jgi:tetratricopeptide (TPR) repeat protein
MMLFTWRFIIQPARNSDQAQIVPKDSTNIQQPLPVQKDTLQRDELKNEKKEEPMAETTKLKKGRELYADNFEPYTDESLSIASRSDEDDMSAFEKFQLEYGKANYKEALETFQKLTPAQQENDNLRFLKANALMAVNQFDEVSTILDKVSKNPKSNYKTEALYYLALCEVRKGQFDPARKNLTNYLGDPDALKKVKAKTLLADMK